MQIEEIDHLLSSNNLKNPTLSVLEINATLYHTFIFQPKSRITATPYSVAIEDTSIFAKCKGLIDLASDKNAELVIMPEYACPKAIINEIASNGLFPREGNLWILGCQSLSKDELKSIVASDSVEWLFEQEILNKPGNFVNPVFYFFMTRNNDDVLKKVGIIQFKTIPSVDLLERDNMICGEKIYVLKNNPGSTYLVTYLCSDVLSFNEADFSEGTQYIHHPFLIIHLQLNPNPRHSDIQRYKQFFLRTRTDTKEIISLNWARQTRINGSVVNFGGSALYTKSAQLDETDQRISSNHKNGLYYTFWGTKHAHVYYLNNDEAAYYFRNTKVSQIGAAAATVNRTGPEILETYFWCTAKNKWKLIIPNDGLTELCTHDGYDLPILTRDALNPIDKERIATISCGYIRKPKSNAWYHVRELEFFLVHDEEIIKRVTFAQDPDPNAVKHRREICGRLSMLINTILNNNANFPRCISDLFHNSRIGYFFQDGKYDYDCNLNPIAYNEGAAPATVVFIGLAKEATGRQIYDDISILIGGDKTKRLVIWYLDDGHVHYICDERIPKVGDTFTPGNSISKEN